MSGLGRAMIVAGESSGDGLAAELVEALRRQSGRPLEFFGAGGPRMRQVGVRLAVDLTQHAVVGIWEPLRQIGKFRRLMRDLEELALETRPDVVILVDYSGFNLRLARRVLRAARERAPDWRPRMVYFISPQVWASRAHRARQLEADFDLLLSIFPFEVEWYRRSAPRLTVRFVGHPLMDRFPDVDRAQLPRRLEPKAPQVVLLPGSRQGEIQRHFPIMVEAAVSLSQRFPEARFCAVASSRAIQESMQSIVARSVGRGVEIEVVLGGLDQVLPKADLALACSGTITMELAWFAVPSVVVYRTSWVTYQIAKRLIQTPYLAMPNILASAVVFPELIQGALTVERLTECAQQMLTDAEWRQSVFTQLDHVVRSLGEAGAAGLAAAAVVELCQDASRC